MVDSQKIDNRLMNRQIESERDMGKKVEGKTNCIKTDTKRKRKQKERDRERGGEIRKGKIIN